MDLTKSPAEQVVEVMTRIYDLGLTTSSGGNISMVDDTGALWVTPSGIDKGKLLPEDIIKIMPDGKIGGCHKPSMEYRFHREIYRARPDIRSVIHAHPPGLVACSFTGCKLSVDIIPSLSPSQEHAGFIPYALPGSEELSANVGNAFASGCHSAFMENHGIITTGGCLPEAFQRFEILETIVGVMIDAAKLGETRKPSAEGLDVLAGSGISGHGFRQEILFPDYEQEIRKELAGIAKRAYQRRLVTSISGGFSARLGESGFLITPEGKDRLFLEPADLVLIRDGKPEGGMKPSGFLQLHAEIYRRHSFVNSIASAHPAGVMAFAVTGTRLETKTIPESYLLLNEIPSVPFRMRFTAPEEIAQLITPVFPAVLIENDCITVTGNSPFQIFDRLEVAEFTARSILNANSFGRIRRLSDGEIKDLEKKFR